MTSQLPIQTTKFAIISLQRALVPPHFEKGSATHDYTVCSCCFQPGGRTDFGFQPCCCDVCLLTLVCILSRPVPPGGIRGQCLLKFLYTPNFVLNKILFQTRSDQPFSHHMPIFSNVSTDAQRFLSKVF